MFPVIPRAIYVAFGFLLEVMYCHIWCYESPYVPAHPLPWAMSVLLVPCLAASGGPAKVRKLPPSS